uniref:Uncharacterized protein n=1 Tax=Anguilla anguilla TaxID=7936 RepID=A0A0E9W428_ANGAN
MTWLLYNMKTCLSSPDLSINCKHTKGAGI